MVPSSLIVSANQFTTLGPTGVGALINSTAWGVLVARHQRTALVSEALTIRGVDHFIPMIEDLRIVRGRHVRNLKPLLGEYVLISISSVWKSLLAVRGVAGILLEAEHGMPAQVLPREVERMRTMCPNGVKSEQAIQVDGFEYGDTVVALAGPFTHHRGKYQSETKHGHSVLFVLFGRDCRVVLKSGDLQAV